MTYVLLDDALKYKKDGKLKKEAVVEPKRACNLQSQSGIDLKLFMDALKVTRSQKGPLI